MAEETIELIKYGTYLLTGILGWFVKVLWDAVKELQNDLHKLELRLSNDYMPTLHVRDIFGRVMAKLDKIEDYLLNQKDNS